MNLKDYVDMLNKYLESNPEHATKEVVTSVGDLEDVFPICSGSSTIVYVDGEVCDRYGGEYCCDYEFAVESGFEDIREVVYV